MTETEADTRANRIDPVLLSADHVLSYRDRKLAVIEPKRAGLGHTDGADELSRMLTQMGLLGRPS